MIKNFEKYLQNIPNLPYIVIELDDFRKAKNKNSKHLIMLIKNDKELYKNILKIIDFDIFYFENKKKNLTNFIALTSLDFVIALATSLAMLKTFKLNFFSYASSLDDFLYSIALAMRIVDLWLNKVNKELRKELLIPSALQEVSKPIISSFINENKLTEQFLNEINLNKDLSLCEEKFTNYKVGRISANILKKWELSHHIILPILFSCDLENCPEDFKAKAIVLKVLKQVSNLREKLEDENVQKALNILTTYAYFDTKPFLSSIEEIKINIEKNLTLL